MIINIKLQIPTVLLIRVLIISERETLDKPFTSSQFFQSPCNMNLPSWNSSRFHNPQYVQGAQGPHYLSSLQRIQLNGYDQSTYSHSGQFQPNQCPPPSYSWSQFRPHLVPSYWCMNISSHHQQRREARSEF